MDEYLLYNFILNLQNNTQNSSIKRLLIYFPSPISFWDFYTEIKKCGWSFKSDLDNSSLLKIYLTEKFPSLIWIKEDRTVWFTSLSANEGFLTLIEFKRNYNLYTLFESELEP